MRITLPRLSARRLTGLRSSVPAAALILILAGCGTAASAPQGSGEAEPVPADSLTLTDGWAKAVPEPDGDAMTGVFGTLTNPTETDIHLTAASSPAAAMVELHETSMDGGAMVMREAPDGFVVPSGGTLLLEPGGNHIMLMALTEPVPAGSDVVVTLTADDGTEVTVTVAARTFAGAQETYAPGQESHTSDGPTATHSP